MASVNRELADFLRRTRGSVDPWRAGLPPDGRVRRVPGLRREEVAFLAGVSTDYYTRLEQGRRITPSSSVLDAIARALSLDETGRAHLGHLVDSSTTRRARAAPTAVQRVRPGLYQLLEGLHSNPAMILGRRTDVLASNHLARALLTDFERLRPSERNYARWVFLTAEARNLFLNWDVQARAVVENLRLDFGNYPEDRAAQDLVADLKAQSPEFSQWWNEHRVYQRTYGTKHFRHPIVGDLTVDYETLTLPGDPDQALFIYTTEPGSASREALDLLSSWTQPSAPNPPTGKEPSHERQ
jgi:transcriptional regulator with XRE-family HTH domain